MVSRSRDKGAGKEVEVGVEGRREKLEAAMVMSKGCQSVMEEKERKGKC